MLRRKYYLIGHINNSILGYIGIMKALYSLACITLFASAHLPVLADDGDNSDQVANKVEQTIKKAEKKMENLQDDTLLFYQMQQVANYMSQYCIQNKRWPEPGDQTEYVVKQLNELVPNNPYKPNDLQNADGFSTDATYHYEDPTPDDNIPGEQTGAEGSPNNVMPDTQLGTSSDLRVKLAFNPSLTAQQIKDWQAQAPLEWREKPGTIIAISNSSDLFVIWGAGADGKPVKSPNGTTRLYIGNVNMYSNDMSNY